MALFSRLVVSAVVAGHLGTSLFAQDGSGAAAFPFEGEVTVENLNVRLAPKTDPGTIIASVLRQGDKVVVTGEVDDYYIVRPPRGASVWIYGRHVQRESDGSGRVMVNDAALRLDSRVTADKVGALQEGARVTILREHLGWYQIAAPDTVRYYAAKRYIRHIGPAAGEPVRSAATAAPQPKKVDAEAKALIRQAEKLIEAQNELIAQSRINEVDFGPVIEAYESAAAAAKTEEVKREAEWGAKNYRNFSNLLVAVRGNLEAAEKLIESHKQMLARKWETPAPQWDATGYVDTVGLIYKRPGSHKLKMADRVVCFLKTKEDDEAMRQTLNRFYGKYVGVKGKVSKDPDGWPGSTVIEVESIEEIVQK